jgi:hypothetical protein
MPCIKRRHRQAKRIACQRFADLRWAGFLPQMFIRSTKLSATTKLSAEHETPPIANVLLADVFLIPVEFRQFSVFDNYAINFSVTCNSVKVKID